MEGTISKSSKYCIKSSAENIPNSTPLIDKHTTENGDNTSFGLSSFDPANQQQLGESLRIAMALVNSSSATQYLSNKATSANQNSSSIDNSAAATPVPTPAITPAITPAAHTAVVADIGKQLKKLTATLDSDLCMQIELLVRFDELEGWRESGARHCIAWMTNELSISRALAWEKLRVGRKLRTLPVLRALFRSGSLGWCKIRLLTRVANANNERLLAASSLDASVSDVERLCDEYQWSDNDDGSTDSADAKDQDAQAMERYLQRSLTWRRLKSGNTEIRLVLPPELAQNVLKSLEHCQNEQFKLADEAEYLENQKQQKQQTEEFNNQLSNQSRDSANDISISTKTTLTQAQHSTQDSSPQGIESDKSKSTPSISQHRADAAVMMAERSLAYSGDNILKADRYQVLITVDAESLVDYAVDQKATSCHRARKRIPTTNIGSSQTTVPRKKPLVEQTGPIALSTVLRIANECKLFGIVSLSGEPVSIGRLTRLWPVSMRRAILARDRHCQFPGCECSRNLKLHHLTEWQHGGDTSVENGMALCQYHHTLVHEGGYRINRRKDTDRSCDIGSTAHVKNGATISATKQRGKRAHSPENDANIKSSSGLALEDELRADPALALMKNQLMPTRNRFEFKRGKSVQPQSNTHTSAGIEKSLHV